MKAMLLAAGKGSRLGVETLDRPKPMLRIGGVPILEHNVRLLAKHGIRDLIVNLHHAPEVILRHFGRGEPFGVTIEYSVEPELLGTAGAVKRVADRFSERFLVMYGDNLTGCDLGRLLAFHREKGGIATVAVFHRENATASGVVEADGDDRIVRFVEKPKAESVFSPWVNAGILVLETGALDYIPEASPSDFGRDVLPALVASDQRIYAYRMREPLWWVDSPEDLARTRKEFDARGPFPAQGFNEA